MWLVSDLAVPNNQISLNNGSAMQDGEVVVSEVHIDSDNMLMPDDPLLRLVPVTLRKRLQGRRSIDQIDFYSLSQLLFSST